MEEITDLGAFELEAYWGTSDGVLMHGTISVEAASMEEAMEIALEGQLIPPDLNDHDLACENDEYFEDHYDVEPIGDEYNDIRAIENWRAATRAMALVDEFGTNPFEGGEWFKLDGTPCKLGEDESAPVLS